MEITNTLAVSKTGFVVCSLWSELRWTSSYWGSPVVVFCWGPQCITNTSQCLYYHPDILHKHLQQLDYLIWFVCVPFLVKHEVEKFKWLSYFWPFEVPVELKSRTFKTQLQEFVFFAAQRHSKTNLLLSLDHTTGSYLGWRWYLLIAKRRNHQSRTCTSYRTLEKSPTAKRCGHQRLYHVIKLWQYACRTAPSADISAWKWGFHQLTLNTSLILIQKDWGACPVRSSIFVVFFFVFFFEMKSVPFCEPVEINILFFFLNTWWGSLLNWQW